MFQCLTPVNFAATIGFPHFISQERVVFQSLGTSFVRPILDAGLALLGRESAGVSLEPPPAPGSALVRKLVSLLLSKGRGLHEVCACLVISADVVRRIVEYIGADSPHEKPMRIYRSSRFWTPVEKRLLFQLWPSPLSLDEIAEKLGRSRQSALAKARSLGLYVRGRGILQNLARESEAALFARDGKTAPYENFSFPDEEAPDAAKLAATDAVTQLPDVELMSPLCQRNLKDELTEPSGSVCEEAAEIWAPRESDPVDPILSSLRNESAVDKEDVADISAASEANNLAAAEIASKHLAALSSKRGPRSDPKRAKQKRKGRRNQKSKAARRDKTGNITPKRTLWTDSRDAVGYTMYDRGETSANAAVYMALTEAAIRSRWSNLGLAGRETEDIWKGEGPSPLTGASAHLVQTVDRHTGKRFWCRKEDKAGNFYSPATRKSKWARENGIPKKYGQTALY
jgi:hypothetical protein